MKVLPFCDLTVVEDNGLDQKMKIETIAELGKEAWEVCHIAVDGEEEDLDSYLFQVGYMKDGSIVTSRKSILFECECARPFKTWEEYNNALPLIREHLEMYCAKIKLVPAWGTREFEKWKEEGRTVRTLYGPHKGANLKVGEKREVILTPRTEMVYGPKIGI